MMDTMENSQFCVSVHCVLGHNVTEATCPRDLFQAYECCKENGFNVTWVDEADALKMNPQKEDVFIMSEFSGNLFSYLQQFKCTIIGPQCLLVCIQKNMPLPDCNAVQLKSWTCYFELKKIVFPPNRSSSCVHYCHVWLGGDDHWLHS